MLGASDDGALAYYANAAGVFPGHDGATTVDAAEAPQAADPSNYPPATGTARVSADGAQLVFLSTPRSPATTTPTRKPACPRRRSSSTTPPPESSAASPAAPTARGRSAPRASPARSPTASSPAPPTPTSRGPSRPTAVASSSTPTTPLVASDTNRERRLSVGGAGEPNCAKADRLRRADLQRALAPAARASSTPRPTATTPSSSPTARWSAPTRAPSTSTTPASAAACPKHRKRSPASATPARDLPSEPVDPAPRHAELRPGQPESRITTSNTAVALNQRPGRKKNPSARGRAKGKGKHKGKNKKKGGSDEARRAAIDRRRSSALLALAASGSGRAVPTRRPVSGNRHPGRLGAAQGRRSTRRAWRRPIASNTSTGRLRRRRLRRRQLKTPTGSAGRARPQSGAGRDRGPRRPARPTTSPHGDQLLGPGQRRRHLHHHHGLRLAARGRRLRGCARSPTAARGDRSRLPPLPADSTSPSSTGGEFEGQPGSRSPTATCATSRSSCRRG